MIVVFVASDIVAACSARKRGRASPDEGELPPSKKSKRYNKNCRYCLYFIFMYNIYIDSDEQGKNVSKYIIYLFIIIYLL